MIQQSHSWHISRKDENCNSKRYMHPNVHSSTIYNSQDMGATWMSTARGMDKQGVLHIFNGISLHHWKLSVSICSNLDGPRDYHNKGSKSVRDRQIFYDNTYANESIYKIETTHRHRKVFIFVLRKPMKDSKGLWMTEGVQGRIIQILTL